MLLHLPVATFRRSGDPSGNQTDGKFSGNEFTHLEFPEGYETVTSQMFDGVPLQGELLLPASLKIWSMPVSGELKYRPLSYPKVCANWRKARLLIVLAWKEPLLYLTILLSFRRNCSPAVPCCREYICMMKLYISEKGLSGTVIT